MKSNSLSCYQQGRSFTLLPDQISDAADSSVIWMPPARYHFDLLLSDPRG